MLNCRRNDQAAWFHNNKLPKACFLPVHFFINLVCYNSIIKKQPKEGIKIFTDNQREVVRGETYPKKKWGEEVEIIYGVIAGKRSGHLIGMAINVKKRTITLYYFGLEADIDMGQVKKLAFIIPALMLEAAGEEIVRKDLVPFKVEKAEGQPMTNFPNRYNSLFVVKMLECHSLGLKDVSSINDSNAMFLRRKLACDIFNQFVRKEDV